MLCSSLPSVRPHNLGPNVDMGLCQERVLLAHVLPRIMPRLSRIVISNAKRKAQPMADAVPELPDTGALQESERPFPVPENLASWIESHHSSFTPEEATLITESIAKAEWQPRQVKRLADEACVLANLSVLRT